MTQPLLIGFSQCFIISQITTSKLCGFIVVLEAVKVGQAQLPSWKQCLKHILLGSWQTGFNLMFRQVTFGKIGFLFPSWWFLSWIQSQTFSHNFIYIIYIIFIKVNCVAINKRLCIAAIPYICIISKKYIWLSSFPVFRFSSSTEQSSSRLMRRHRRRRRKPKASNMDRVRPHSRTGLQTSTRLLI